MKFKYYYRVNSDGNPIPGSNIKSNKRVGSYYRELIPQATYCCDSETSPTSTNKTIKYFVRLNEDKLPISGSLRKWNRLPVFGGQWQEVVNKCCTSIPIANVVTISPSLGNPGGTGFLSIPATNFGGSDTTGTISFLRITTFPTNLTTFRVNNINYTSGTIGTLPDIPTNALGQPTWTIQIDPIDGAVTSIITYNVVSSNNIESTTPGSVSVPMFIKTDLGIGIVASPTTTTGITAVNSRILVTQLNNIATINPVIVTIPKDPKITFTYNSALTIILGNPVQNVDWTYDSSNPVFHIFTHSTVIAANGTSAFGLVTSLDPGGSTGVLNLTSTIASDPTEGNTGNNSASVTINYAP